MFVSQWLILAVAIVLRRFVSVIAHNDAPNNT